MPAIAEYESDGEEFNDDTDLPLPAPSQPSAFTAAPQAASAPTAGGAPDMASLQAMMAAMGQQQPSNAAATPAGVKYVDDDSQYRSWHPIYPIYLDAKRAYGKGGRRIPRELAHWWPQSREIVGALRVLGLPIFHETEKTHPQDWANPGRVKTLYEKEGKFLNPKIKTRKQLYLEVSAAIHANSSSSQPRPTNLPPPIRASPPAADPSTAAPTTEMKAASSPSTSTKKLRGPRPRRARVPVPAPPEPLPPLNKRYPEHSPAVSQGMYLQTVINAEREEKRKAAERKELEEKEGGSATKAIEEEAASIPKKEKKEKKAKMVRVGKR